MIENAAEWPPKKLQVLEATITTIARDGFDRATTAAIARRAKVGEGTIYRYFENKENLISAAAEFTSQIFFGQARENYSPNSPPKEQYIQFVRDFLLTGISHQLHYQFMEQYINSPPGIAYRKNIIKEVMANPDIKPMIYPLNRILHNAIAADLTKKLPLPFLVAMTIGPIDFILKHTSQGFMELDNEVITQIAHSCWDGIRRTALE